MRKLIIFGLTATLLASGGMAAAAPSPVYLPDYSIQIGQGDAVLQDAQYRPGDRRQPTPRARPGQRPGYRAPNRNAFRAPSYWNDRQPRGYYQRNYGRVRRDNDSAVAAGFLGFLLGAAIMGSNNDRDYANTRLNDQSWTSNCSRRYRSFDMRSGTYLGNDGYRHYCR